MLVLCFESGFFQKALPLVGFRVALQVQRPPFRTTEDYIDVVAMSILFTLTADSLERLVVLLGLARLIEMKRFPLRQAKLDPLQRVPSQ